MCLINTNNDRCVCQGWIIVTVLLFENQECRGEGQSAIFTFLFKSLKRGTDKKTYMQESVNIYHSFHFLIQALHRRTLTGVSVAEAVPTNHHVVDGIIVLLSDLHPGVQEVISQRVQLDEFDSQICDL